MAGGGLFFLLACLVFNGKYEVAFDDSSSEINFLRFFGDVVAAEDVLLAVWIDVVELVS